MSPESSKDVIMGIIIVIVIAIVGYLAYNRGFFNGQTKTTDTSGVQVNVGGNNNPPPNY